MNAATWMVLAFALITVASVYWPKKKAVVRVRTGRPLRILNPRRAEGMQPHYLHWDVRKEKYVNLMDDAFK